jgi:alpha-tubulin suppressor-like RCC1 family protein
MRRRRALGVLVCAWLASGCGGEASHDEDDVLSGVTSGLSTLDHRRPRSDASLAVGLDFQCALRPSGTASCRGDNGIGQRGSGTVEKSRADLDPNPTRVLLDGVVSLSAKNVHACAVRNDRSGWCWGFDFRGEVGTGRAFGKAGITPVVVDTPARVDSISDALSVSAGVTHTCAVLGDGSLWCWGDISFGELGADHGQVDATSVPMRVVGIDHVARVSAGGFFTCAVTVDRAVYCWGDNPYGMVGNGTAGSSDRSNAVVDRPTRVIGLEDIESVSASTGYHACAVKRDGTAWCWGANFEGQLGDGTREERDVPVRVPSLVDVVDIQAGRDFTCALERRGTVWCWGDNRRGQLGGGLAEGSTVPLRVEGLDDVVAIAAGGGVCAEKRDGTIFCWGALSDIGFGFPVDEPRTPQQKRF